MEIPRIETPRLVLRAFEPRDLDPMAAIVADPDVVRYMPRSAPWPPEVVPRLFEIQRRHWEECGWGWYAVECREDGALLGWCGLNLLPRTGEVEIKYFLRKSHWGRGYATEAALRCLEDGFRALPVGEIVGLVHPENRASANVLRKLGMRPLGEASYFGMALRKFSLRREDWRERAAGRPAAPGDHMTPGEFRRHGRAVVDWIAAYQERVESLPVLSRAAPGSVRATLPPDPPLRGEPFETILADVGEKILPGITHWQSPRFFAFFPANASGPSILGEMLSAGLGVQGMLWATSPACTELETHVLDWLAGMLDLPPKFLSSGAGGGVIQDTASSATLCALLAARERATGFRSDEQGCDGRLVAYASREAHSSVEKAARIAGIGRRNLRLVEVDGRLAMRPEALARRVREDRGAGLVPAFACATVGTTSTNAVDPLRAIGEVCRAEGLWLHVDAAMSGTAALCPEFRWIHEGLETADSYCFNPHKWMFTNFDCDCFWVADRAALVRTLSVLPEYLRNRATESGAVLDYRDWHVPLGRRFRALKLWFVIRHYGVEGLRRHVRAHVALAQRFAGWVRDSAEFELAVPPPLNLVCFRHRAGDEFNRGLLDRLNRGGRLYLTHTTVDGRLVLRFCVGQTRTEQRHVEEAWSEIRQTALAMAAETGRPGPP